MTEIKRNSVTSPIAVDIFSGCGGTSYGLVSAGYKVIAAIEIDEKAQQTYLLNHPAVRLYRNDVRNVNPQDLMADLGISAGDLDLLAGCPPCQGFSRLGTKNQKPSETDSRNELVNEFMRFVEVMEPKTIMLENVPALAKDVRFSKMKTRLEMLGYSVVAEVLDAADYEVPQRRKRLIMLASRLRKPKLADKSPIRITVRSAFAGLSRSLRKNDLLHAIPENRTPGVMDLIAKIPKNGGSRSDLGILNQLECHKRSDGFRDVYGRMAWDQVSPTITSGCHNPSKGRFLHPSRNRTITLREAAVLQGFPSNYVFVASHGKEALGLMIGNALPPPFIAAHAKQLLQSEDD